jgi:hypothetical protein
MRDMMNTHQPVSHVMEHVRPVLDLLINQLWPKIVPHAKASMRISGMQNGTMVKAITEHTSMKKI